MDTFAIVGCVISGILALLLIVLFVITNYKWRTYDVDFGIDPNHAAETAPLAAIIGWCSLSMAAFVIRAVALLDVPSLLTYTTALVQITLFIMTSTKIPKKITLPLLLPSITSVVFLCLANFQRTDFSSVGNALFVFLLLVLGVGAFVALVALHWKTREKLIVKVSKAEKQIKKAKRWFIFGTDGDAV